MHGTVSCCTYTGKVSNEVDCSACIIIGRYQSNKCLLTPWINLSKHRLLGLAWNYLSLCSLSPFPTPLEDGSLPSVDR